MDIYTLVAIILIAAFFIMAYLCYYFAVKKSGRGAYILAIYFLIGIYTVGQGVYYAHAIEGSSPDENAHISYVYYLHKTGEIIPSFENMDLFAESKIGGTENMYKNLQDCVNYLCHPPLYYQIMKLAGGFTATDDPNKVIIDKWQLRYFSLGLFVVGLALLFYIGYSRLDKDRPWLHFVYATCSTCVPMLAYEACAVTNDTLAFITACVCILGLIRFSEKKRGVLTYVLIASGITGSLLTKMTTAILCVFMALIVLAVTIVKERSIKDSLPIEFWITCPIYFIALAYFAVIYSRYGVIQPSLEMLCTPEYFQSTIYYTAPESRVYYTPGLYLRYYFKMFFLSWSGVEAGQRFMKLNPFTRSAFPIELLWLFPFFIAVPAIFKKAKRMALPVFAAWASCVITFIIQLKNAYGTYLTRGYRGGFQSRYYIPFIFAFSFGLVFIFQSLLKDTGFDPATGETTVSDIKSYPRKVFFNQILYVLAIGYAFLVFYGNFPFFLRHFAPEL